MTDKFKPWDADPRKRPTGPMRFAKQENGHAILQVYCFGEYTAAYCAKLSQGQQDPAKGEFNWFDLPVEEE